MSQPERWPSSEKGAAFSLSRRRFLGLASLAAGGAAVACGNRLGQMMGVATPTTRVTDVSARTPARGGTLVVGMAATSIVTLDPAAYSDRATETVVRNIFDGLVTRTVDNEVVPELAQEYRWVDGQTVDFELKRNVTFHNGDKLTAEDVVFSFERILHQAIGAQRRGFAQEVESVQAVDTHAVRFNLKSPWPVFLQMLVHNQIVPKGYASRVGDAEFAKEPVGCGPFKLVRGALDDRIVLERFEEYYGGAHLLPPIAPPSLDGAVFRMIPDAHQRIEALLHGETHIVQNVPPQEVPRLVGVPEVAIKTTVGTSPKFIDLNVTLPPFDDPRVRLALNYAVDAERLLTEVAGGYGVILAGPLSPANLYVDSTLRPYGYAPESAISLLSEAGYAPQDISFTLDAYGPYIEIAEAVAEQLRGFGMEVRVQGWDYAALRPALLHCERQAFVRDWGDSAFDPVGYLEAKWQTYSEGTPAGRGNYACYSNPRVDELIQAGASEPEPAIRRGIYAEAQRLIYEEAPAVFLYVPQEIEAASVRVHNWQPSPDGRINLHDVWLSDG